MKYFIVTPKASEKQSVYYSEIVNQKNEIITYSYLARYKINHNDKLSCAIVFDGIHEPIIFNKDGIPLIQRDIIRKIFNEKIDGVEFIPLVNDYYAMFVYNNFNCIEQIKNDGKNKMDNQFILNNKKIYSEIFRITDTSIPFIVSESIYNKLKKININNIDFSEIQSG